MTSEDVRRYMEEHLNNLSEYIPGNAMREIAALFSMVCEMADRVYDQEELIRGFEEVTLKDVEAVIPLIADFSRYSAACVSSTRADLRQIMKG